LVGGAPVNSMKVRLATAERYFVVSRERDGGRFISLLNAANNETKERFREANFG
jgi:hypothetical protein